MDCIDFKEKYQLISQIAQGGFGTVYLGQNLTTQQKVAIKVQLYNKASLQNLIDYIHQEISIMKQMKNPNIVEIYESFENDSSIILVMEYCSMNLSQFCQKYFQGLIPENKLLLDIQHYMKEKQCIGIQNRRIFQQILQMNKNKNSQIMNSSAQKKFNLNQLILASLNNQTQMKLVFKQLLDQNYQWVFQEYINYCFIAPEIINEEDYNFEADIFSLGILIYKLAFNQFPFDQSDLNNQSQKELKFNDKNFSISKELQILIEKMLDFDKTKRLRWEELINHDYFKLMNNNQSELKAWDQVNSFQEIHQRQQDLKFEKNDEEEKINKPVPSSQHLKISEIKLKNPSVQQQEQIDKMFNYRLKYKRIHETLQLLMTFNEMENKIFNKAKRIFATQITKIDINDETRFLQTFIKELHKDLKEKISTFERMYNNNNIQILKFDVLKEDEKSINDYTKQYSYFSNMSSSIFQYFSSQQKEELVNKSMVDMKNNYQDVLKTLYKKIQSKDQQINDKQLELRFIIQSCMLKIIQIWPIFEKEDFELNEVFEADISLDQFSKDQNVIYDKIFQLMDRYRIKIEA